MQNDAAAAMPTERGELRAMFAISLDGALEGSATPVLAREQRRALWLGESEGASGDIPPAMTLGKKGCSPDRC